MSFDSDVPSASRLIMTLEENPEHCNNTLQTNKYDFTPRFHLGFKRFRKWFLIKAVAQQFRRLGNIYFLVIGLIMAVGWYSSAFPSAITPWTTLGPLALVVSVSLLNEFLTDRGRHNSDKRINLTKFRKVSFSSTLSDEEGRGDSSDEGLSDSLERTENTPPTSPTTSTLHQRFGPSTNTRPVLSQNITTGSLLYLSNRTVIPADCIMVACSGEVGYVETSNIDGETNLKVKVVPKDVLSWGASLEQKLTGGKVEAEQPNASVHTFSGVIEDSSGARTAVDEANFLVRGSVLRNTEWVIALVVYTGVDTKLVRNSRHPPSKLSQLDRLVNRAIWMILAAEAVVVTICAIVSSAVNTTFYNNAWYLTSGNIASLGGVMLVPTQPDTFRYNWLQNWFTFLTIYSNLVPLSLYVTLEVTIFALMHFISTDVDMFHEESSTPAMARSNTVADLGMVQYIFSDKTGTLTANIMEFKRATVRGNIYGKPVMERADASMGDYKDVEDIVREKSFEAEMFVRVMALCHTVVVEATPGTTNDSDAPEGFEYQAESPDESALVNAGSALGYQLLGGTQVGVRIKVNGNLSLLSNPPSESVTSQDAFQDGLAKCISSVGDCKDRTAQFVDLQQGPAKVREEEWEVLAVNKFDSDRKRMSVLLRSPAHLGRLPILFCKGADSSMLVDGVCIAGSALGTMVDRSTIDLSTLGCSIDHFEHLLQLQQDLAEFARDGLRTLVMGVRVLSEGESGRWIGEYKAATEKVGEERNEALTRAALSIERNIYVVGASGIEDKLQDGVPSTIDKLGSAGIKIWVLTGDKKETAIEIGYATLLLKEDTELTIFDGDENSEAEIKEYMAKAFIERVKSGKLPKYSKTYVLDERVPFGIKLNNFFRRCAGKEELLTDNRKKLKVRHHANILVKKLQEDRTQPAGRNIFAKAKLARRFSRRISEKFSRSSRSRSRSNSSSFGFSPEDDNESVITLHDSENTVKPSRLERLFAVDKYVRHGLLKKHVLKKRAKHNASVTRAVAREESDRFPIRPSNSSLPLSPVEDDREEVRRRTFTTATLEATPATDIKSPFSESDGALIITGSALKNILGDHNMEEMLFNLAACSKSVIACRVSPKQKALLVKMVKKYVSPRPVTLAIGDGANDVGMIQEAQVGIGISGLEGQQAVNNSDFAIAQFRFLAPLLLVHGRWNYVRMAKVCMYSFYKNAILVFTIFYFQIYCHWTGRPLYDEWVIGMYNFVLGFPILFIGIFDRDVTKRFALDNPETYIVGRMNQELARRVIYRWATLAVSQASIIYFFSQIVYGNGMSGKASATFAYIPGFADGSGENLAAYGTTTYATLVVCLTIKVMIETKSFISGQFRGDFVDRLPYTWIGLTVGTFGLFALGVGLYQFVYFGNFGSAGGFFVWVAEHTFVDRPWTYLFVIVVTVACTTLDVTAKLIAYIYFPSQTNIYQEISKVENSKLLRERKANGDQREEEVSTNFCCGFESIWGKRKSHHDDVDSGLEHISTSKEIDGVELSSNWAQTETFKRASLEEIQGLESYNEV